MNETSIINYDEDYDDDRSFFHRSVKETSSIKYDDDDGDSSFFHRLVKETSIIKYAEDDDDGDRVSFTDL